MVKKVKFMEIFHEAYKQKEMDADEYLIEKLYNVHPYSLVFKKLEDKGGD